MIRLELLAFLILLLLVSAEVLAQDEYEGRNTVIYFKDGDTLSGKFEGYSLFHVVKLKKNDSIEKISASRLDSLWIEPDMFRIRKGEFPSKTLIEGDLIIRETIRGNLLIHNLDYEPIFLQPNQLDRAYQVFCTNGGALDDRSMDQQAFLAAVRQFNAQQQISHRTVLYDSLRKKIQPVVLRVGFFLPEVGIELGIAKWLTLYNSIGMNFFGHYFRNARTVVNYATTSHLRIFPGFKRRLRKGKDIYKNSGFYIGPAWKYGIEIGTTNNSIFGIAFGWQGNNVLNKGSSFTTLGIGYDPFSENFFFLTDIVLGVAF